ncbi:MAG: Fe-S cluster assembly protein NifU [Verrucomicrobia bacterium]|nr:Fe-S cluster assembly protein NifU [Verrucomicrobiota bacterium]
MWDYSEKVKDHFFHPRNVGTIENPDGVGEVGSLACGDALRLMFTLDDQGRIAEVKFQTFGCGSAIAASSALTEMIRGMTLDEASKITNQDIADYLGGLPEEKMHCSVMGREALEAAIANYRGEKGVPEAEGEVVCRCFGVTDKQIERAIKENGLTTVEQVTYYTKAGGGCQKCHPEIQAILDRITADTGGGIKRIAVAATPRPLTNIQKVRLVEETIEREIRPMLRKDGGDIELIDFANDTVYVALRGSCSACALSGVTLKDFVEAKLREFVVPEIKVEEWSERGQ